MFNWLRIEIVWSENFKDVYVHMTLIRTTCALTLQMSGQSWKYFHPAASQCLTKSISLCLSVIFKPGKLHVFIIFYITPYSIRNLTSYLSFSDIRYNELIVSYSRMAVLLFLYVYIMCKVYIYIQSSTKVYQSWLSM